ncbi:MAG: hypothetical protein JWO80_947 [Bryobacterales bacterium]|nr:hypothetical protein [Bryobacterales bacterium]
MNEQDRAIGLDIGTSRIVTARRQNEKYEFTTQLNAFLPLPYSKITQSALRKESVPHQVEGAEIVVYGNESERFANMFHLETRRPMMRGVLNPGEPNGLGVIRQIVQSMVGEAGRNGTRLCVSLPGAPIGSPDDLIYHEATLKALLTEMGFQVNCINEGMAVVLAELEDTNYTGIGISCGGGMCNVCLSYLAMPVFSFSVPKGGDFIDSSAASVAAEGATRIRAIKEASFHFNGFYSDNVQQALTVYYEDMILAVIAGLKDVLSKSRNVPRLDRPLPVVVAGGSAMPAGFRDRFEKLLGPTSLPIAISEIRMAGDPLHATAKGALVSALAEI